MLTFNPNQPFPNVVLSSLRVALVETGTLDACWADAAAATKIGFSNQNKSEYSVIISSFRNPNLLLVGIAFDAFAKPLLTLIKLLWMLLKATEVPGKPPFTDDDFIFEIQITMSITMEFFWSDIQ